MSRASETDGDTKVSYALTPLQPSSRESSTRKSYQKGMMGAVDKCHSACASMNLPQGGKSKSSRAVAAVVSNTKNAALLAKAGRYDFGLKRNLRNNGKDDGSE